MGLYFVTVFFNLAIGLSELSYFRRSPLEFPDAEKVGIEGGERRGGGADKVRTGGGGPGGGGSPPGGNKFVKLGGGGNEDMGGGGGREGIKSYAEGGAEYGISAGAA